MESHGFTVQVEDVQNLASIKRQYHIPPELQSCHTAIVDGYVLEGHVPVAEIERLLSDRPEIAGIAVAGMPAGSPGMDFPNTTPEPFDVIAFDESGKTEIFTSYPE